MQRYNDGNLSDDDDDDDSSWESDDEGDCCPAGCPKETYDLVLELRENRYKLEDELKVFQREMGITKRNHEQFCTKERQADRELEEADTRIQAFQDKKQQALNGITSFVPLSAKQMYLWGSSSKNNASTPVDNSSTTDGSNEGVVVFSKQSLDKLHSRIHELREETASDKRTFKDLHSDKRRMGKENRELEQSIAILQGQCEEIQLLKFGQLVDIVALDKMTANSLPTSKSGVHIDMAKETEIEHGREVLKIEAEISSLKMELKDATTENTRILNAIADLNERQIALEQRKPPVEVDKSADKAEFEEASRLNAVAAAQTQEIAMLKAEITKLKRKDGTCVRASVLLMFLIMHAECGASHNTDLIY